MITEENKEVIITDTDGDKLYINPSVTGVFFETQSQHLEIIVFARCEEIETLVAFLSRWLKSQ